nr:hypothetical protein GCM10020092_087020 [Actinoplanes digitatis]
MGCRERARVGYRERARVGCRVGLLRPPVPCPPSGSSACCFESCSWVASWRMASGIGGSRPVGSEPFLRPTHVTCPSIYEE